MVPVNLCWRIERGERMSSIDLFKSGVTFGVSIYILIKESIKNEY